MAIDWLEFHIRYFELQGHLGKRLAFCTCFELENVFFLFSKISAHIEIVLVSVSDALKLVFLLLILERLFKPFKI